MKYLYWSALILVLIAGLTMSIYFGLQPKPIPKINYSYFKDPTDVADALMISQAKELMDSHLLIIGVIPGKPEQLEVAKALLQQSQIPSLRYQVLVVDESLVEAKQMFPSAVKLNVKADFDRFLEGVKNAENQGLRMAVVVPIYYSVPMLRGNFLEMLKLKGLHPMSVSMANYPAREMDEKDMEIPCAFVHDQADQSTGPLGCAIQNKAKLLYREKHKPWYGDGVMDQVGEKDFLILLNPPTWSN